MNLFQPHMAAFAARTQPLSAERATGRAAWWPGILPGAQLTCCGEGRSGCDACAAAAQTPSTEFQAKRSVIGQGVFLLIGQSNMLGYGAYFVAPLYKTDPRIKQWTRAGVVVEASEPLDHPNFPFSAGHIGRGLAFARDYPTDLPGKCSVLLVPDAQARPAFPTTAGTPAAASPSRRCSARWPRWHRSRKTALGASSCGAWARSTRSTRFLRGATALPSTR